MVSLVYGGKASFQGKRKKKSRKQAEAEARHKKEIEKIIGKGGSRKLVYKPAFPDLKAESRKGVPPTSDAIPESAPSRDFFFRHFRNGNEERTETLLEIQRKAHSVGPAYNKGGLVYQTRDPSEYKKV